MLESGGDSVVGTLVGTARVSRNTRSLAGVVKRTRSAEPPRVLSLSLSLSLGCRRRDDDAGSGPRRWLELDRCGPPQQQQALKLAFERCS